MAHEALVLPQLTEVEKASPIGASMGYLLGLFFSLKKQLLTQRAMQMNSTAAGEPAKAPSVQQVKSSDPHAHTSGPIPAVYDSFAGNAMNHGGNAVQTPGIPMTQAPPNIVGASSMDWSSTANPVSGGGGSSSDHVGTMSNPVAVHTGSTRNNLEASSMMKREMQNQMAFQNKMRALKQQELNKYKNVPHQGNNSNANMSNTHEYQHHQSEHHQYTESHGQENSRGSDAEHQGHPHNHPQEDPEHGGQVEGGDGTGETGGAAGGRERAFSMEQNDEFWNADVMDEQLFEFLMDN